MLITNHGWIAAQELHYSIPSHPCWEIKPMVEDLGTLPAFGSIKIPVSIRRIGDSGCQPCEFVGGVNWKVYAANLTNSYFTPQFFIKPDLVVVWRWLQVVAVVAAPSAGLSSRFPSRPAARCR